MDLSYHLELELLFMQAFTVTNILDNDIEHLELWVFKAKSQSTKPFD